MLKAMRSAGAMILVSVCCLCGGRIAGASGALEIINARVAPARAGAPLFWQIAASPTNPEHVVICALQNAPTQAHIFQAVLYGSTDGGETWHLLKEASNFPDTSETTCAIRGDNTIYFVMSNQPDLPPGPLYDKNAQTYFWGSPDFGKTWKMGAHIPYADAGMLVASPNHSANEPILLLFDLLIGSEALYPNRWLSIFEDGGERIRRLRQYPDKGCERTPTSGTPVSEFVTLPGLPASCAPNHILMEAAAAVNLGPNTVGAAYLDFSLQSTRGQLLTFSRVSRDGKNRGAPVVIAALSQKFEDGADDNIFAGQRFPSIGIGPLPGTNKKRLYAVWHDRAGARVRILESTSDDLGTTWTAPRPLDDGPERFGANAALPSHPSIAVNQQGIVGVSWAEFSGRCWRFATSENGGKSFDASVPLNPCDPNRVLSADDALAAHADVLSDQDLNFYRPLKYDPGAGFGLHSWRYSYEGLIRGMSLAAAQDGSFFATWAAAETRDDGLHATHILLPGNTSHLAEWREQRIAHAKCCLEATPTAARAALYYTSFDYDPATREFEVGAVLVRHREPHERWPLVLRIKQMRSLLGPVSPSNADNHLHGIGAAWVFEGPGNGLPESAASENVRLLPSSQYAFSKPRMLRFRLNERAGTMPLPATIGRHGGTFVDFQADLLTP